MRLSATDQPLLDLLKALQARDYDFVTPTPATHARVLARPDRSRARSLRDVFGWSLPFDWNLLEPPLLALLQAANALEENAEGLKSRFRVSSLQGRLFLHSAYPTEDEDAVFFGPDSYRFADFVRAELTGVGAVPGAIVDIGTGTGVGGLVAAAALPSSPVVLTDINVKALRLACVNARFAGQRVELVRTDGLKGVRGRVAVALANPPYIADDQGREYRDGGDMHGGKLSLDMALEAAQRLEPGGRLLLYTGAAIVDGRDELKAALEAALPPLGCDLSYRELDPDVFGEELTKPPYADVERIAVIGAVAVKRP